MIKYKKGFKYQLVKDYKIRLSTTPPLQTIDTPFISLTKLGTLTIKNGYAWDGPSGPTIDTKSSMRASLVHDVLYQLLRQGKLPQCWRETADNVFYDICIEDGMWAWRAKLWYRELRKFAAGSANPKNKKQSYTAP